MLRGVGILALFVCAIAASACGGGGSNVNPPGGGGGPTPPPTPTPTPTYSLSIQGLPNGPLAANTGYSLSVAETVNAQPTTPGSVLFSVAPSVGTMNGNTLQTGLQNGTGSVTATDSSHKVTTTANVTVLSTRPANNGNSYQYAGQLTQQIVRPLPAPSATQPPYAFSAGVSQNVSVSSGQSFNNSSNAYDFHAAETDSGGQQGLSTTTDTFYTFTANGSVYDVFDLGYTALDSNGVESGLAYAAGNGLIDTIPETLGQFAQNTAAATTTESDPDRANLSRTTSADGSYNENDAFAGGVTGTIQVNSDGSGTLVAENGSEVQVSAPQSGTISITVSGQAAPIQVPVWYPNGSVRLYSETDKYLGAATIPPSCKVAPSVGASANQLTTTVARLDTVMGFTERTTTTSWIVQGYGVVCTQVADVLKNYYDYSGQNGSGVFSDVPQQITTTNETIGLTGATVVGISANRRSGTIVHQGSSIQPQLTIRPALSAIRRRVEKQRIEQRLDALRLLRSKAILHFVRGQ